MSACAKSVGQTKPCAVETLNRDRRFEDVKDLNEAGAEENVAEKSDIDKGPVLGKQS